MCKVRSFKEISDSGDLCTSCSWTRAGRINGVFGMCEGSLCDEAYETYVEEVEELEDTEAEEVN